MSDQENQIHAAFKLCFKELRGERFALDVDVVIPSKGVTAIFGASGSGKTTFLRCMIGLEKKARGSFRLNELVWQGHDVCVPVHRREQGVVFQEASLFSHLTVQGNLDYAAKRAKDKTDARGPGLGYAELVDLLGIRHLLNQSPVSLSGGERQRVAIARALLTRPKILYMDEPLAALDYKRKQEVLPYLEELARSYEIPIIYVSHSLDEVARLADYILLMDQGRVVAQGPLETVLSRVDLPVALDNDLGVVLPARVTAKDSRWHLLSADFEGGQFWIRDDGLALGEKIRVRVLARDVSLSLNPQESSILNSLPATVADIVADSDDAMALVRLRLGSHLLIARITRRSVERLQLVEGMSVWAQIKSVAILS